MRIYLTTLFFLLAITCFGQDKKNVDSLAKAYYVDMKIISASFAEAYYPHRREIYSLNEPHFLKKIDSLQQPFMNMANKYAKAFQKVDKNFILNEQRDISYFFDRLILDYPYFHENHTGKKIQLSKSTQSKLNRHLVDFNNPTVNG